jgi:hypothetical protein
MRNKDIDIGSLNIPKGYFEMSPKLKKALCNKIIESMLMVIEHTFEPQYNRIVLLNDILESSIITNQEDENYEVCAVLADAKELLLTNE